MTTFVSVQKFWLRVTVRLFYGARSLCIMGTSCSDGIENEIDINIKIGHINETENESDIDIENEIEIELELENKSSNDA